MRHIRSLSQFSGALAVIAPESNFGNFAADIETELLLQGFDHFVIAPLANGGHNAGLYTSHQNKTTYSNAVRNMLKLGSIHVWDQFLSVDDAGQKAGDLYEWLAVVQEVDKYWIYVFPSKVAGRPPRIELTAKRNPGGMDDDVICLMLAVRMLVYWAISPQYFTSLSNPLNHSRSATEEMTMDERIAVYQLMNQRDIYGAA